MPGINLIVLDWSANDDVVEELTIAAESRAFQRYLETTDDHLQ